MMDVVLLASQHLFCLRCPFAFAVFALALVGTECFEDVVLDLVNRFFHFLFKLGGTVHFAIHVECHFGHTDVTVLVMRIVCELHVAHSVFEVLWCYKLTKRFVFAFCIVTELVARLHVGELDIGFHRTVVTCNTVC